MYVAPFSKGFRVIPRVFGRKAIISVIAVNRLLLETSDFILLEIGDRINLE